MPPGESRGGSSPLPGEITAGCGLGWRMLPEDWQAWQSQLNDAGYDAATPVEQ